jgi:transcription elongation GreA/GreB family factor
LGAAVFHAHPPPHRGESSRRTAGESAQNCVIAPAAATAAAGIGSMVRICDLRTGEREEYILVPPAAADIRLNRISTLSPIGRAVFGRRAGETVEVDAPAGAIVLRIERVRRARKEAGMRRKP